MTTTAPTATAGTIDTAPLPRATPESQGVDPAGVLAFVEAADRDVRHLHSVMLLRGGSVVAEGWWRPYAAQRPHVLFSLSKSFTSTAVGMAVAEGRLSLDDKVTSFFTDALPAEVGPHLAAMQVRHLLMMGTGQPQEPMVRGTDDWAAGFLAVQPDVPPGTRFHYNSLATYMCSAIVQRVTGQTLTEYLRPRLYDPLGIERADWQSCPRGVNVGGWGLSVTTESIARFGQLYLQRGEWRGRQLVPAEWVDLATSTQIANGDAPESDWAQGYGFQFWRCRHGAYRGDGAFGQYCVVMPEQDAVLAITSGLGDMQQVLNLAWEHLLPAMRPAPLPDAPAARRALEERLAGLALPLPEGKLASPAEAKLSGRTFAVGENERGVESLALSFDADGATVRVRQAGAEHTLAVGRGAWREGTTTFDTWTGEAVATASAGAWADDSTFVVKSCLVETPFIVTATFRLDGDELRMTDEVNVAFGPTDRGTLVGRSA